MQFDQKNYGNLTLLVSLENQGTKSQKTPWKTHGPWSIRKPRVLGIPMAYSLRNPRVLGIPMAYPLGNPMGVEKLILNPWWDLN